MYLSTKYSYPALTLTLTLTVKLTCMLNLRPSFFNYLVYGSADPIFQDLKKKKMLNFFLKKKKNFFFLQIFSCRSQARIKEEDLRLRPALNPLVNKLWSPAHNEREELEPTDPVQGYDTISK